MIYFHPKTSIPHRYKEKNILSHPPNHMNICIQFYRKRYERLFQKYKAFQLLIIFAFLFYTIKRF